MTNKNYNQNARVLIKALEKNIIQPKRCDACAVGVMIAKRMYRTDIIETGDYSRWAIAGAYGLKDHVAEAQAASIGMTPREAYDLNTIFEMAYDKSYSVAEGVTAVLQEMESMVEEPELV